MKLKFFPIIFGLLIYFFVQNAVGQDFSVKKKYRDWAVYSSSSNECFLASKAKRTASYFNSREVLGKNRENSFIYLSVNKNNTDYSMSYFSDYPLKINISGTVNIDDRKVLGLMALSSNESSSSKHAVINRFMKEDITLLLGGSRLTIELQGRDGSILVDQFSLMGFTKSFNYLLSSCN